MHQRSQAAIEDIALSMSQVREMVVYSPSHIYRLIKAGSFPAPIRLGPARVAWRRSSIINWLAEREHIS